jgi:hypothetical protein
VTGDRLPRLLVLDDREGLVRSAPGIDTLRQARFPALELILPTGSHALPGDDPLGGVFRAPP